MHENPVLLLDLLEYVVTHSSPVQELDIFKHFFPETEFNLNSFAFFKAHFYIHNALRQLPSLLAGKGFYLFIQLDKAYVFPFPPEGFCSWFLEESYKFCFAPSYNKYCRFHQNIHNDIFHRGSLDFDGVRAYYLDMTNIEKMDEESFNIFSKSGLFLAEHIFQVQNALKLFSLKPNTSLKKINERFRFLAKQNHPDTAVGAIHSFQDIKEAYCILKMWKNG